MLPPRHPADIFCSAPTKSAATDSPGFSMPRASRSCSRPLPPLSRWRSPLLIAPFSAGRNFARPVVSVLTTICLALPWIFLFIILRAELPLDTGPIVSVLLTFGLMGVAGWAWPARIFSAAIGDMQRSGWMLHARASGISGWRIAVVHVWPHLRAVAIAQFRILVPAYILAEASLGLLGLGVPEPLPSWGNLLRDLQHPDLVRSNPWILAPLALLMIVMICLEALQSDPLPAGEIE